MRSSSHRGVLSLLVLSQAFLLAACGGNGGAAASNGPPLSVSTGPTSHVHVLEVRPNGGLLLADQQGLWSGTAEGRGWKKTGPPLNRLMATCLVQTGSVELACSTSYSTHFLGAPRGVWRSTDDGSHWTHVAIPNQVVVYLAASPAVPGVVVAYARDEGSGNGGIWISRDSGRSWHQVEAALGDATIPIGLALLPGHPFSIVFAEANSLHLTENGGKRWTSKSLGSATAVAMAVSVANPRALFLSTATFAGQNAYISKSTDGGQTWHRLWKVQPTSWLATASDTTDDIYGYTSGNSHFIYRAHVVRSGRRMRYVVTKGTVPANSDQIALAVDPHDPMRIYSAWSFPLRLYRSEDGGRTWKKLL